MLKNALIIFARRPELGKVKTRLAAQIGDAAALAVYKKLLEHTRAVAYRCGCDTHVFLTEPAVDDFWNGAILHLQSDGDLGRRLEGAFGELFQRGYERVVIVGSDCPGLEQTDVEEAFRALDRCDFVIGPAADGGYYLLGMKQLLPDLFRDITWSTSTVLSETLNVAAARNWSSISLGIRNDVDVVEDLPEGWLELTKEGA